MGWLVAARGPFPCFSCLFLITSERQCLSRRPAVWWRQRWECDFWSRGSGESGFCTGTYIHCPQRPPFSSVPWPLQPETCVSPPVPTPVPDSLSTWLPPSLTHILSNTKFEFYDDSNKLALAHKPNGFYFGGNLISIPRLWHILVIPFDSQLPYNFFLIFSFLSCNLHWG